MSALSDYLDKYTKVPDIPEGPAPGKGISDDSQSQDSGSPGLFDRISAFLSNAGQAYASADNPGAEIYSQTPYADNLTNEVHDQNMADGQNIYTVLAPDYTPRPLDDSVYTDIPGTPVDLGTLEDESVRNARMQDSADYMAANWPRLYGAGAGAVENGANVVGGIQNALGLGDSTLQNAEQFEKGMQDYRKQWDATYGDSYFLNPNNFANDAGAVVGSSAPILALSAMTPGALVAGGSRALTGALSRAGLGRLAMSKAGQALIADTVRTLPSSSLADSLSEYGGVVHDLMQKGMSEDEARAQAVPIFYKNMALDTAVLPLELGIAKGGKGLITGLLRRNAGENMGKGIAKGTARTGILSGLSGLTEGYQEGAQNALEDQTKGERDGGWYNPVTWTPEDWKSARAGFVGGALMGIPGNVATAYHPDTKQADLSPEAQTQVQDIKNTLINDASYGNMDSDTYNSYLELANSGNPELIKLANDSLASWKEKQGISTDSTASTDMTAGEQTGPVNAEMEAEKDRIRQYLNDNTIDQMGGQENYDWLYNTLNSTDPDEVHKAYQTVVDSTAETQAQEAAQAEQQAESQPAGNFSINSDNPFIGYVVKAANDQGIDPKIALSIAARETGGDDVNAINMAPNGGLMQVTEESANDYGVNDLYPDWRDDPEQNAEAGMYILKKKIEEQGGDTWAGVRAYNGAGEAADQYLNQIQQNYDNLGDIGGSSWSDGVSGYDLPTQSDEITAQVETLKPGWKQALPAIGGILNDMGLADGSAISSAGRTSEHNAEVGGAEHSYHINDDERGGGDAVDIVLPEGTTEEQAQAVLDRFKSTGAFKEVLFHDAGSGYHLHLGGYTGGLNGMNGNVDSDMSDIRRQQDAEDRAFDEQEREINDDSRAAMNRIMNDNSVENAFDETQRDTEAAKKQQEETLKALTSGTQEEQPVQTPETAQNQPQDVPDTTVDATAPIEQQTAITGANTATKAVQQNQPVQTAQAQPIQTPAGTQDPRITKAIHDPAMLNLVTRAMNGDSAAKESAGKLNQNIVDAVQRHIIATALNAHQQRIAKAPAGKTETILSDDVKTEYPAQYKIVSADDITPSNNTDGSVNAFYPQQYQPRDRTRAGMRKQVEDMANKLNPSALGASSNANMGAPVINSQGVVLNGNGRTMALKSVYKGKPKQIKAYKDFLKQNAKSLGIDPATIDSIKNPVLVRQVADDAPVQDIINSKAGGSQMSAGETAKKDADRIKQSTLQLASDSSDLTQESNRKFVNSVLKDVASPEELNTLYTKTGKISQAGITRVKNAVFAKAYGDDFLLTKMSESTDNNIRNVMNSMLAVAPKVAMLNDGMEKGLFYSYPLSDVISGSAKTLISLREQNKPVKFYLEETSLISENENQNSINDVLQFIDKNKRSGKAITAFFNELCNEIELQGHPDQGALIPTENPTMEEVINIAEGKVENNGVQSLFDTGRSEGNQTDQASGRMADRVLQSPSAGTETNAGINGRERKEESAGKTESRPEVAKGEANEESTESNHVDTEPQQTESKDKESTHAEEGSQGDVQEEVSKFHNVLDDEKTTPKQVIDAYKSVVDKVIANANRSRKNAKIGDKIVTDEYQSLTNSKHWNAFMNEDGGRNWHEVATINADAHKTLRAIIKTAGVKTKEAPSSQGVAPYRQAVDDIMDKLAHKKLTPTQAINKLKTIMKDANAARWGEFKAMEAIESKEKLSFDDYKMALDLANDAMKKANDMRLEASRKRKARKTAKELESSTEETKSAEQPKEEAGFTDEEIKTLTDRGFNRWTKKLPNGKVMDRLYIKPEYLGLELTRYKSGNISSAKFNGETISNSEARRIEGTKCYVDVATKEVVCDREDLKQAAQEVVDDALSKEKSQVPAQAEKGNKPDELRNKLSDGGKQAYDYAIDKLSKGNEKVAQSAKENAFIYARMAERWSEIMHEYGNKTYSPEDYTKSHPIVMGQQSGNAQLERAFEQRAWHGSPYDFDSFDLGYIGAGEGNQVHGWGLYFAKDKKISEAYKDIFGYKDIKANVDGKTYHMDEEGDWTVDGNTVEYGTAMGYVLDTISNTGNKEKAIADLESSLNKNKIRGHYADEARKAIDILKNRDVSISKGETLYSVEIPNNAYLLDEDKPIYNQSKTVKRSLLKAVQELPEKQQDRFLEKLVPGLTAKSKATIKAEAQLNTMQSAVNGLKELDEKPLSSLPAFRQRIRKSLFEKIVGSDNVEKVISDTAYRNATIKKLADDVTKQGKIILQLHKKDADRSTARRKELKDNLAQTINTYGLNGKHFYESLSYGLTGDVNKQADASKYLDKYGIKGIKYIGNTDGQCFVIFDDKAVQIIDKYNQDVHNAKAAYDASTGAIRLFDIADQSSFIHESAHMFLSDMERLAQKKDAPAVLVSDLQTVKDWAGYKPGQMNGYKGTALEKEFQEYADAIREAKKTGDVVAIKSAEARWIHERFARGFERYIADGKAPNESLKNVFEKFKDWMVSIYHDLKNLGKKPPKEIQDVMARMITPEVDTKYSVREAHEQLTRSKEDLKTEIKEAFPTAKEINDEGDRMTFTMPNSSHITVDMKNEIVLTDKELAQAKKDHHIDDNGNVVVEGYAEARGKDAYITLAQGSREGTGFHEAYHIAEDAVLTDREKAAIKKAIPDAEERADKYAEWVEARKHGRGTAWGKLFQKIKDFAAKMKTILTGAENVHNVFRKIESGEVWERNANGQNSGRRYSVTKPKDAAEEAREKAEQNAEDTTVTLNEILTEARKIVPIYTKSKVGEKSPAKYHYDARQRAGFVPGSFDVGDIGSAIALHIDSIGEIKGANIELTKDIIEDRQMEQRNAKKYKSKVPPDISPSQARQEGVRNFGRLYFIDNERAKETYPQYYDLFEKALDGMPKEKAGVEKVLALQDQRVRQNPLLSAAAGISNGKPDSQLTWKERMKKRLLHLYAQMVDETDPIGQLTKALELETGEKIADEKDPHKRALMCNSAASARAFMLLDGDNRIANLKALNKTYKGAIKNKVVFADIIDKLGKVTKDELKKAEVKDAETLLSMYLIAARTEEIVENNKDYIRPDGYGHETCMRILVNAPQAIKEAATLFWKYNENLVNIIEQQGLITHAAAEGMRKYKKYCPMYRDFNEGDSVDTHISTINTGRGFINQTSGIKSLSGGSSRPVINPVDSMINMTTVLIGKCERNNVAKIMVQCAEDHGGLGGVIVRDPTLTGADRQRCAFTVLVAGKKAVYRTTPELYESITQMDTNSAAFMSNLFGKFTDALRFGATNTPSFMMRNFIRDTVTASINSKYGFKPLVDSFRGMWKLTHDKQFKADFYAQGVPMDTYIRNDIRGAQDFKKKLRKNLKKYPFGIRQAMWFMSATARKYNNVGELIEQGTRAGEFLKARKKGATEEEAGYAAREVSINFSRHGSVGKKFNRYIPFFNASIQGIDKFIRTFKEDPKRAIWATIKYIILPSLACWAFNHDDDWYKDLDPTTKYLNWCIHIPGTDTHFLIPKPQEVGVMFGSGIEAVLNQFLADDPKAMKQWAWELAGVMTPGLAVTMIRPFFEWQRNYSLWTNHNLVPKRLEKLPSEQQYTNSTSELAKLLGDTWIAKNISVGDRHGISPIAIDNFFSAWFGSMGRTLAKTLDKPIESLRGKDRPTEPAKYWYESPVIGSFVSNDDSQRSAYVDRLYDLSDQMETDYKRSDSYAVQKGKKGAKVPTELAQVRTAMKTVSKLNKEIRDIQDNPKMSAEEKRTQIDTRKVKMRGIAKKAVLKLGE